MSSFQPGQEDGAPLTKANFVLGGVLAAHLGFLPWALGDMHAWSQEISGALAVAGFALASAGGGSAARRRLFAFPVFWLGLAYLGYVFIQALNPAWEYVKTLDYWWMSQRPYRHWLPHGMITPFAVAGPWRRLLIDGSAWLLTCSIWIGITRRRTLRLLGVALVSNGAALAVLGLAERALHAAKIFWSVPVPNNYFVASFFHKNHAGAYFDLMVSLGLGLTLWYWPRRRWRRGEDNPWPLLMVFVGLMVLVILCAYSRAATVLMLGPLFLAPVFLVRRARALAAAYAAIGLFLAGGLALAGPGQALGRMRSLVDDGLNSRAMRPTVTKATIEMFKARPVYGWGADGFRFCFTIFQQRYPLLRLDPNDHRTPLFFEHANNDYAEFLAEFGLVGALIPAALLGCWAFRLIKLRIWRDPATLFFALGAGLTLLHAAEDFPFHNPAVWLTWCALATLAVRWGELDASAPGGHPIEAEAHHGAEFRRIKA